ncbi:diacylglycerol kinase [Klugiella xanthotipulae]|uniref:Diacylglycerol kinase n=1 Tax=Klugiella xanthotipulae TaxID=244735 RepID=A0A543I465_9MICO|nr:diacylglycerol kinase family protein [Klugiella xanthotipulae]TQM65331.1 diacylglycerol kinase [Klugiella xanthotipulae]
MPDSTPHVIVAINPAAATGQRGVVGARVADALRAAGFRVSELRENSAVELRAAVERELASRPTACIVVGGDGLVSLVLGLLVGTGIPLGIVPAGTGNDLARGLGLPLSAEAATRLLVTILRDTGRSVGRLIDTVETEGVEGCGTYVGALSAGLDAQVNARTNRMTFPRGRARYVIAVAVEFLRMRPRHYLLTIDGVDRHTDALLVTVANNGMIGGGMNITPDAQLDDGLLDVFIVHRATRLRFIRLFPKVFSGAHSGVPEVEIVRAREVRVASEGLVGYADGERMGSLPLSVRVAPSSLRVLV